MTIRIAPVPHEMRRLRERLVAVGIDHGLSDAEIADFVTAICEAVANAIEHAETREPIEISCVREDNAVIASVTDRGVGFDVSEKWSWTSLSPALIERGRGLPIMRRCSDIFSIESAPGRGTTVTVGRYVGAGVGAGDDYAQRRA